MSNQNRRIERYARQERYAVTDLHKLLVGLVHDSGVPQVELAQRTGFSQKHVSEMMNGWSGTVVAWDQLLTAAGVSIGGTS